MNSITRCCILYLSFINIRASTDLSRHEGKIKTYHDCIAYSFLLEGCFFFPIFLCFPKRIKFDQNFVTKKPKQEIEIWLAPIYGNKCLQILGCLRCFKTKGSRHCKIKCTYIIYIITSFVNSETIALLHLTSFTEDVTNIGFHMPIWEIFSEFLRFCNLFHEPLGE